MKRALSVLVGAAILGLGAVDPAQAAHGGGGGHGGGWGHGGFHGGFHGHGHGHVFIGGGIFFDPFFPYYWYPYPYAYPYPYPYPYGYPYPSPGYSYSPPPEGEPEASAPEEQQGEEGGAAEGEGAAQGTYGLVQLRGVPDGASIDLDGRFWMTADALGSRWLALPSGTHTIAARVRGARTTERRIEVKAGTTQVVRFGPLPRDAG